MAAKFPRKWQTTTIWVLRILLGVIFLAVGISKLTGTGRTVEYFAAIGWGQWFRYLTGCLDLAGTALLFVPRMTAYGAIVLACSVGLAALLSLSVLRGNLEWGGPQMILAPLFFTLLAATLAWLTLPRRSG